MTILVDPRGSELARLAKVLGLLGSSHAGERSSAALKAEEIRKSLGTTWGELLFERPKHHYSVWVDTLDGKLGLVMGSPECLNDWEKKFVASINGKRRLTLKQRDSLDRIVTKVSAFQAARGSR
jgi:hypothetical protein